MNIFSFLQELTYPSLLRRIVFFLFFDVLIIAFSLYLSFLVHFEFNFTIAYWDLLHDALLFFIGIKIVFLAAFRVYNLTWRYVGVSDLLNTIMAIFVSEMALVICSLPYSFMQLPLTGFSKRVFLWTALLPYV